MVPTSKGRRDMESEGRKIKGTGIGREGKERRGQ